MESKYSIDINAPTRVALKRYSSNGAGTIRARSRFRSSTDNTRFPILVAMIDCYSERYKTYLAKYRNSRGILTKDSFLTFYLTKLKMITEIPLGSLTKYISLSAVHDIIR